MENKKIFIFGGSGSLGNKIIDRYINNNIIVNYSRDECKHWRMELKYNSDKLSFIIGNIRDYNRVEKSLIRENPNIIIIAAALKHINKCEFAVDECIQTNFNGPLNVLNAIDKNKDKLTNLECLLFVSTDKACSAISSYGASKFLSERIVIEKSYYIKTIKFINVRYGNVLNSNGSIIPILHAMGKDPKYKEYTLTHELMTRFLMTLDDSVDLIEYAILHGESGDIVIPEIISIKIKELFELFSEKYNKPIKVIGLRSNEKLLETLINSTESMSVVKKKDYYHIKPHYASFRRKQAQAGEQSSLCNKIINSDNPVEYSSDMNPLTKEELKEYLMKLNLL